MTPFPTRQQILDWIAENPEATAKRDIAKAFNIKGSARIELKRLLKELEAEGRVERRRRSYQGPERLPPVTVVEILPPDADGDLFARPLEWQGTAPMPRILFAPRKADPAVAPGERVLVRLAPAEGEDHAYQARLMRRIGTVVHRVVGIFRKAAEGGRILPIDKGADRQWQVRADATLDAQDGELVEAEQVGSRNRLGLAQARIIERLGDPSAPRAVSLIAIHQHGIPDDFPDAVMAEADASTPATMKGREDLRDLPLVTIDPVDARDHDDAVAAMPDDDPRNEGGMVLWVAIALSAVGGVTAVASSVGVETLAQERTPDHVRGRVFGSLQASIWLASLLGAVVGGVLGEVLSVLVAINVAGILVTVAGVVVLLAIPRLPRNVIRSGRDSDHFV